MKSAKIVTTGRSDTARRSSIFLLYLAMLVMLSWPALLGATAFSVAAQGKNDWRVGNNVGLSKGTQIREGPGFSFCYHTVVPQDNWAVQVTGGPVSDSSGQVWYDTSRKAAGDPSGGTGWVRQQQADASPAPRDGGEACPNSQAASQTLPFKIQVPAFLTGIEVWWSDQLLAVKFGVLAGALLLLVLAMRWSDTDSKAGSVNGAVLGFAKAILIGVLLGGVADLTRSFWESTWHSLAGGVSGIDLALILLVLPISWFLVSLVLGAVGRVLAIVFALIQLVLALLYLFPDRANSILTAIGGLFGGGK